MAIRTGNDYLDGLRKTEREVWIGSERIESVADHPLLGGGALGRPAQPPGRAATGLRARAIGGANLLAAPSRGQLDDLRVAALCREFLPGAGEVSAEERSELFRLAWDFLGSSLGSRNDLYERHYLGAPTRTRVAVERLYAASTRERGDELLDAFLASTRARQSTASGPSAGSGAPTRPAP